MPVNSAFSRSSCSFRRMACALATMNPTSVAMAPTSAMWLYSLSSSSSTVRINRPRRGTSTCAKLSIAWQKAVEWLKLESPEMLSARKTACESGLCSKSFSVALWV